MALAAAAVFEGRTAAWSVEAAVVDHRLHDDSGAVSALVGRRLLDLGCRSVDVLPVEVSGRGSVEAMARAARYAALAAVAAEREATVLLGHTRDDQAETVLLGLARGSGLRSLSGMAPRRGPYRRPLLGLSRACTHRACRAAGIVVWDDPDNVDDRYARVRVRRAVLPVLEQEIGPGIAQALARTADLARLDADALDHLAQQLHGAALTPDGHLSVAPLAEALPAVRRRVLRIQALRAGAPASDLAATHVDAMERLVSTWHGQGALDLPGGLRVRRSDEQLRFAHDPHR